MTENCLTKILLNDLAAGNVRKIARHKNRKINFAREVGNNSFRADICISLKRNTHSRKSDIFLNSAITFIAIEVKIRDWRQGLYQAWRYNSFAEKSYLALYEPYSKNVKKSLFARYNVGLIIFNEKGLIGIQHPKKRYFTKKDEYSLDLRKKIWESLASVKSIKPAF